MPLSGTEFFQLTEDWYCGETYHRCFTSLESAIERHLKRQLYRADKTISQLRTECKNEGIGIHSEKMPDGGLVFYIDADLINKREVLLRELTRLTAKPKSNLPMKIN